MSGIVALDTDATHLEKMSQGTSCWTSNKAFFGSLCSDWKNSKSL